MKDKFGREIKRSEADVRGLAALQDQIDRLQAEKRQREEEVRVRKQTLVGQLAIEAGVTELPASVIAAGLRFLAHHGRDAATAERWIAEHGEAPDPSPPRRMGPNTLQDWNVGVRVSPNTAKDTKQFLVDSGLHWNGRRRQWTGKVDEETQNRLREQFGDRMETRNSAVPSSTTEPDHP